MNWHGGRSRSSQEDTKNSGKCTLYMYREAIDYIYTCILVFCGGNLSEFRVPPSLSFHIALLLFTLGCVTGAVVGGALLLSLRRR